jgi:hypothetical protein
VQRVPFGELKGIRDEQRTRRHLLGRDTHRFGEQSLARDGNGAAEGNEERGHRALGEQQQVVDAVLLRHVLYHAVRRLPR